VSLPTTPIYKPSPVSPLLFTHSSNYSLLKNRTLKFDGALSRKWSDTTAWAVPSAFEFKHSPSLLDTEGSFSQIYGLLVASFKDSKKTYHASVCRSALHDIKPPTFTALSLFFFFLPKASCYQKHYTRLPVFFHTSSNLFFFFKTHSMVADVSLQKVSAE